MIACGESVIQEFNSWEINEGYIQSIQDLYNGIRSAVKCKNKMVKVFKTMKELLQGCCMPPTLIKIYMSHALKQWTRKYSAIAININDFFLDTLLSTDDQVVIAGNKEYDSYMLRKQRWVEVLGFGTSQ